MSDSTPENKTALAKWFEREFPYKPPVDLFPAIVERLRGAPVRVEELCTDMVRAQLTERDGVDWSVQEHVGHLGDLEALWTGRLDDFSSRADVLRPADLTNAATHEAGHNDADIKALLDRFRRLRTEFVARLDVMTSDEAARTSRHPRLDQPMRLIDHCFFVAEHDDHHLAIMHHLVTSSE